MESGWKPNIATTNDRARLIPIEILNVPSRPPFAVSDAERAVHHHLAPEPDVRAGRAARRRLQELQRHQVRRPHARYGPLENLFFHFILKLRLGVLMGYIRATVFLSSFSVATVFLCFKNCRDRILATGATLSCRPDMVVDFFFRVSLIFIRFSFLMAYFKGI